MSLKENPDPAVCPVCAGHHFQSLFRCTDHFVSGRSFPLYRCLQCGFIYTGSAPSEELSSTFYQSEKYISHSNTSEGIINLVYHRVREIMLGQKRKIVVKHAGMPRGTLLDVGAGTGYFLNHMRSKGWEVTGTEKSDTAREFAMKQNGLALLPGEALFSLPAESFDVITLWHVMEHLYDLDEHWKGVKRLLKPGGCLVIALPNHTSSDALHYGEFWAAWDVPRHLWHFSPSSLEHLARKEDFRLVKIHRMPFDPFYVSMLSEKYRKSRFPVLKGLFFGKISWFRALFDPRKCSSLIYILKRQ
ncbi:MAG TPA: class I SAM-dependent methyltransferase [Prolixibacteraceae bacterium]|nr:class I SAM-dependent methyltransferase [Prolixibacteraceae bacterium]